MVIAPVIVSGHFPLAVSGSPEFATPDDKCVIEQAAALEIHDQCCGRLIGLLALMRNGFRKITVLIPALVEELDETHAAFYEATGQYAVGRVSAGCASGIAIERKDFIGLAREIGSIRDAGLHAKRHFGLRYASGDFRVERVLRLIGVEFPQCIEHRSARVRRNAFGIREIEDWFRTSAELHTLMFAWKKACAPEPRIERLIARGVFRDEDNECGEIGVDAAQAVRKPSPHGWAARLLTAGTEECDGRVVVDRFGEHGVHDADVVGDFRCVGEEVADVLAALAAGRGGSERTCQGEDRLIRAHAGETLAFAD